MTSYAYERTHAYAYLPTDIYSNKKETSDFHDTVSFDPAKMLQQKSNQIVNQTSDTQKNGIFFILSSDLEWLLNLMCTQLFSIIIRKLIIKTCQILR